MKTYDAMLTLGNGFTTKWGVPSTVENRLRNVAYLYSHQVADKIILSGGYSISWDLMGIKPPTTEAHEMQKMLISFGVPKEKLYLEEKSKDTIGNFYFSKIKFLKPHHWKNILIICTDFHLKRVQFISKKVLGEDYHLAYQITPSHSAHDEEFIKSQEVVLDKQNEFLRHMKTADDAFLATRLYSDPYYQDRRPPKVLKATMNGIT